VKTPSSLGLPQKFETWRRGQESAIRRLLFGKNRFHALVLPVGSGKSLSYMAYASVDDGRTVVLAPTRQLQTQLMSDFKAMGLVDIRGRDNYTCDVDEAETAATAICTQGRYCPLMKGGCSFYDQRRLAAESQLVVTNYSFWLNDADKENLGNFSTVICDEAHQVPDQITEHAGVAIKESELRKLKLEYPPPHGWLKWVASTMYLLERMDPNSLPRDERALHHRISRDLDRLATYSDHEWLFTREPVWRSKFNHVLRWDLLDPAAVAEPMLFRAARRVIFSSASVRRKTLSILGIKADAADVTEQQSSFPIKRRPIYYWPVVKVRQAMTQEEVEQWLDAIVTILDGRADRRGIIHTVSYDRTELVARRLGLIRGLNLLVHQRGVPLADILETFRGSPPGTVLISPAMAEGVDLPYHACEFTIIAKVPFPDTRARVIKERMRRDREYSFYLAAQGIVQSVGRGMRAADDQCETFIVDALFGWVMSKHRSFFPQWFHQAVRSIKKADDPPQPPPALQKK
jgi:Rad3-related DNA helicase